MRPPAVVTVTHRSGHTLPALLETLAHHQPESPVVVVDSGSPEGPPAVPPGVALVSLTRNVGFGAACNAGAAHPSVADATHLAFLNPDVRLQGPTLDQIVRGFGPATGIATGPVVDTRGEPAPAAWGPTSPARAFWYASGLRVLRLRQVVGRIRATGSGTSGASMVRDRLQVDGHVLGGAMVVTRRCFDEIGGFDEGFFLYWEDADLCWRARAAGWDVELLPSTPFVHAAGTSSSGTTDDDRRAWYADGAERFADRHLDPRDARRLRRALRLGDALRRARPGRGRGRP